MAEATAGILIGLAVVIGLFIVIPLIVFLIVRKILSDRHRERMAMIENGMNGKYRQPAPEARPAEPIGDTSKEPNAENPVREQPEEPKTPEPPRVKYYPPVKAEDSTVKWMYVFGGAAVGLLVASLTTNLLFTYTLIETKGLGLSIVVLSICIALYIYYVRKNKKKNDGTHFGPGTGGGQNPGGKEGTTYTED